MKQADHSVCHITLQGENTIARPGHDRAVAEHGVARLPPRPTAEASFVSTDHYHAVRCEDIFDATLRCPACRWDDCVSRTADGHEWHCWNCGHTEIVAG